MPGLDKSPPRRPKIQAQITPSFRPVCECGDCPPLSCCACPISPEAALMRREPPSQARPVSSNRPNPQELKPTTPVDGPTSLALARIEARLGELGQRLGEGQSRLDQGDQQVAQLRRELDGIKQEVTIAVQANKQGSQELSAAVREILQLLRRLMMQSRAMQPMQVPVPIPVPPHGHDPGQIEGTGVISGPAQLPGQAQMPGQDQSHRPPGRGKR